MTTISMLAVDLSKGSFQVSPLCGCPLVGKHDL